MCKGVTDKKIRQAVYEGACRMRDLEIQPGVTSQCGKCAQYTHQILKEALDAQTEHEVAVT